MGSPVSQNLRYILETWKGDFVFGSAAANILLQALELQTMRFRMTIDTGCESIHQLYNFTRIRGVDVFQCIAIDALSTR